VVTADQEEAITTVAGRFGCSEDVEITEHPFELPEGWVLVIMGRQKGRLRSFGVSPAGVVKTT
jgi:hypothetical protein